MKYFLTGLFMLSLIFASCSYDVSHDQNQTSKDSINVQSKYSALTPLYKTTVTAVIEGIYVRDKNDFFVNARIVKVEGSNASSSVIFIGDDYVLIPYFQDDSNQNGKSSVQNKGLESLTRMRVGDTFKAEIFFKQYKGWYIEKVL